MQERYLNPDELEMYVLHGRLPADLALEKAMAIVSIVELINLCKENKHTGFLLDQPQLRKFVLGITDGQIADEPIYIASIEDSDLVDSLFEDEDNDLVWSMASDQTIPVATTLRHLSLRPTENYNKWWSDEIYQQMIEVHD